MLATLAAAAAAAASYGAPLLGAPRLTAGARVVIVVPNSEDPRIAPGHEALAYWNRTFEELGLAPAFGEPEVILASASTRALENYARQISRRAGSAPAGPFEPDPPAELDALGAEVVVLFSAQDLLSFAWPVTGSTRFFLAIDAAAGASASGMRSVIAHELGHALGLAHDRGDPGALMCMPCRSVPPAEERALPPLDARARSQLLRLFGPDASSEPEP